MEPMFERARLAAMSINFRTALSFLLFASVAACAGPGASAPSLGPGSSAGPGATPSENPDFGAIDHPTGAADVVLRFEEGGGFVMPAFLATQAPHFTLYGDGTIVFRNPTLDPPPAVGSVIPMNPMRAARLSEEQIQDLLAYALGEGGLGVARPEYPNDQVADASTAVFTINAGGLSKTVSVYALGMELEGAADGPARRAFRALGDRLQNIDAGGTFASAEYVPIAYRGVLLDGQPGAPDARAWPWPGIAPSDFVSNVDPNAFQLPMRVMAAAEVEGLGITPFTGGFQGLRLIGPDDGKVYSFSARPLLPDEAA
jgi:hypothetical protein